MKDYKVSLENRINDSCFEIINTYSCYTKETARKVGCKDEVYFKLEKEKKRKKKTNETELSVVCLVDKVP